MGFRAGFPVLADVLAKKDNKFNVRAHASATGGPPAMASNAPSDFIFCFRDEYAAEGLRGCSGIVIRTPCIGPVGVPIYNPGGPYASVQSDFGVVKKKS